MHAEPLLHGPHWTGRPARAERDANPSAGALLVGLAAAKADDHAGADELQVADVEADQLGPTEGTGEAQ